MKHSGKSSIGRRVARRLGVEFSDLDDEIESISQKESGRYQPVRAIYRLGGPTELARLETLACSRVSERRRQIVATGGGICDNQAAVDILIDGLCVLLDEEWEILFDRIMRHGVPPFLGTSDTKVARQRFRELYEQRMRKYRTIADITVDQRGLSLPEAVAIVTSRVEEQVVGWK